MNLPVFVYGTLRTGGTNPGLVVPWIQRVRLATILGDLYHLPFGYPAVVVGDGMVHGELMEFTDPDAALKATDWLEGYRGPGSENHYDRISVMATAETGDLVECLVYVYPENKRNWLISQANRILGGDWYVGV